jgi:hypothetical protein
MSIRLADGIARTCAGASDLRGLDTVAIEPYPALEVG